MRLCHHTAARRPSTTTPLDMLNPCQRRSNTRLWVKPGQSKMCMKLEVCFPCNSFQRAFHHCLAPQADPLYSRKLASTRPRRLVLVRVIGTVRGMHTLLTFLYSLAFPSLPRYFLFIVHLCPCLRPSPATFLALPCLAVTFARAVHIT